jgi:hypothetical protein
VSAFSAEYKKVPAGKLHVIERGERWDELAIKLVHPPTWMNGGTRSGAGEEAL